MPFVTFGGEDSVGELADRLFTGLTQRQRATVEAALLRANPRLDEIRRLPPGTVLEVPDIPALRPKATTESPDRQVLTLLAESTRAYAGRLLARQDEDIAEIKAEAALVKSAPFKRAIEKSEETQALAEEARIALEARAKDAAQRRKALETGIGKASADIEERLKGR